MAGKSFVKKLMYHFCVDIDATKTALLTGVNRNTVNRHFRMFREAIYLKQIYDFEKFVGQVELDESYFGGKRVRGFHGKLKLGRGTQKQPVFGVFERNGRVYTEIVPDCKKPTLQSIIRGKVGLESEIHTDSWKGYDGLVDVGFQYFCKKFCEPKAMISILELSIEKMSL
jgi:transposase-like protein